jgi:hypothetical protein
MLKLRDLSIARKKELLDLLDAGEITEAELRLPPYEISAEELAEWRDRIATHGGAKGLRVSRLQRRNRKKL